MKQLAIESGGSFKTVHDRVAIVNRLCEGLQKNNIQIRSVEHLKTKHIEQYIENRLNENISKRTLQNEMAAIRSILAQAGREKLVESDRLTNQALGIGNASRLGSYRAIPAEVYQGVLEKANDKSRS